MISRYTLHQKVRSNTTMLSAVVVILLTVSSTFSSEIEDKTIIIETSSGSLRGIETVAPGTNDVVYQFRKVPYARPPIGNLRFRKPEPYGIWEDVWDATAFGPSCMQNLTGTFFFQDIPNNDISEDCLFMNIYVPQTTQEDNKLPVMIWVHGGGYSYGQGMFYNASNLAATGNVIVVTFNYRLGIYGFFSMADKEAMGNYGIWDQKLVFEWVQKNIGSFGGDPESVTIFGESAGGFSVSLHALIPSNRGLFHRVIAQSGTVHGKLGLSHSAHAISNIVTKRAGCRGRGEEMTMEQLMTCMRSKTEEELLEASNLSGMADPTKIFVALGLGPVVDGDLFPNLPLNLLSNPDVRSFFNSLDFMAGSTNADGSLLHLAARTPTLQKHYGYNVEDGIPTNVFCDLMAKSLSFYNYMDNDDVTSALCKFYTESSSLHAQSNRALEMFADFFFAVPAISAVTDHARDNKDSSTYLYKFSYPSPVPFGYPPPWFEGCGHADELIFFFGIQVLPLKGKDISEESLKFSNKVMTYWTNFAKTGNPNEPSIDENMVEWPQYDEEGQSYINLDKKVQVEQYPSSSAVKFWLQDIPSLLEKGNRSNREEL